jgi:hypothetical protein
VNAKENGQQSAFPDSAVQYPNCLSKRELFAAMAMQGLCSIEEGWNIDADSIAELSVQQADALLAALAKE